MNLLGEESDSTWVEDGRLEGEDKKGRNLRRICFFAERVKSLVHFLLTIIIPLLMSIIND